jgi:hypothetical protein
MNSPIRTYTTLLKMIFLLYQTTEPALKILPIILKFYCLQCHPNIIKRNVSVFI